MDEFNLDFCFNNRSRENVDDVVVKIIKDKSPLSLSLLGWTRKLLLLLLLLLLEVLPVLLFLQVRLEEVRHHVYRDWEDYSAVVLSRDAAQCLKIS